MASKWFFNFKDMELNGPFYAKLSVDYNENLKTKTSDNDYYKINDTDLYISGGLGTNDFIGIRLFCRPSISLYRLSNK